MRRAFPIVYTRDVAGTAAFYERLDFEQRYQFPPAGEPGYVALQRDGADLGIFVTDPEGNPVTLASPTG